MLHQILWGGLTGFALLIGILPAYSLAPSAVPPVAPRFLAQTTVSDQDLQKFADVIKQLRRIEQDIKPKIENVVQSSGITPTRFRAIALNKKDPSTKLSPPITPDEEKKFTKATNDLKPFFTELQTKSQQAVAKSGLTVQQFQSIGKAVQEDPKLKEKVRTFLKS